MYSSVSMLALFLHISKKILKLNLALGGTSGRRESLDLDVRDEVKEVPRMML